MGCGGSFELKQSNTMLRDQNKRLEARNRGLALEMEISKDVPEPPATHLSTRAPTVEENTLAEKQAMLQQSLRTMEDGMLREKKGLDEQARSLGQERATLEEEQRRFQLRKAILTLYILSIPSILSIQ
jgi:hypothetical protein